MNFKALRPIPYICIAATLFSGCYSNKPLYLRDSGDLSYYLEQATDIEYPDVQTAQLVEATDGLPPITVSDPDFENYWNLCLEDCVSIALQNTKVLRGYGTPGLSGNQVAAGVDDVTNNPAGLGTIYNVARRETEPGFLGTPGQIALPGSLVTNTALDANQGVEAALADFDAQFSSSVFWDKTDSPRNTTGVFNSANPVPVFQQDLVTVQSQIAKRTAVGTQLFARNVMTYTANNTPAIYQPLNSWYQNSLEFEVRQPLMRGRGAFVNRMPVVISRISADQEIANLQTQLQNVLTNVEIRYWDLWCAYKLFGISQKNFNEAKKGWTRAEELRKAGTIEASVEYGAREQYFFFQAEVKRAWAELIRAENDLRWLLGVANTDGNVIRPTDEPTRADIRFDWDSSRDDALCLRPELRQQRWEIKKKQLAIAHSKNGLLPNVNAVGLYRFLGLGDELANYDNVVPNFPNAQSGALNELAGGNYQEFRLGLEFAAPVGYRRELSNVRNAQVKLAMELAKIEDMELEVVRQVSQGIQTMDLNYQLAVEYLNRFKAAAAEEDAETEEFNSKGDNFTTLVDVRRRRAQAEIQFYQSLCEYNKAIALIHRRKGTIMDHCGVGMAEGPWPGKAYDDAAENARRRSSSRAMNYGFTRPGVISTGNVPNCSCGGSGCSSCAGGEIVEGEYYEGAIDGGEYYEGEVIYGGPGREQYYVPQPMQVVPNGVSPESLQNTPTPAPLPTPRNNTSTSRRQPASAVLANAIEKTTANLAYGTSFDQRQIPGNQQNQRPNRVEVPSRGVATAQIRMATPSNNRMSQAPLRGQPRSTTRPNNHSLRSQVAMDTPQNSTSEKIHVIQASTDSVVGSGVKQDGNQALIRRVNYEQ